MLDASSFHECCTSTFIIDCNTHMYRISFAFQHGTEWVSKKACKIVLVYSLDLLYRFRIKYLCLGSILARICCC